MKVLPGRLPSGLEIALWARQRLTTSYEDPPMEAMLSELYTLGLEGAQFSIEEHYIPQVARKLGFGIDVVEIRDREHPQAYAVLVRQRITAAVLRNPRSWDAVIVVPESLSRMKRLHCIAHELSHITCADPLDPSHTFLPTPEGEIDSPFLRDGGPVEEKDNRGKISPPRQLRLCRMAPPSDHVTAEDRAETRAHQLMVCASYGKGIYRGERDWFFKLSHQAATDGGAQ